MKKTLFSLAFIAASGAYVAAANHLIGLPRNDETDAAVARTSSETSSPLQPSALPVTPLPSSRTEMPTTTATTQPVRRVVEVNPHTPALTSTVEPPRIATALATPVPPLPRPRPAPPANVAVQTATTSNVAAVGGYRDGTYTGSSENAYYGRVQVQVTVTAHQITNIKVLDFPQDRRTSRYINSQALPLLTQEVMSADSANVDTISGATLTSAAYIRSLSNALSQAGGGNA